MAERIPSPGADDTKAHTADSRNPDWENYAPDGHGQTDEQIRADIHAALAGAADAPAEGISVSVGGGIVTLSGTVSSEQERTQLLERVRAIPSVKELRDETRIEG